MKALCIGEFGRLNSLELREVPRPEPLASQILIRIEAVGLNRADILQTLGKYPAPKGYPQDIPGLEFAGVVEKTGSQAHRFKLSDKVMGLVGGGAFAEYVVMDENEAIPMPINLSFVEAAVLPEAFTTAFDALVLQGGLKKDDRVLVHAVASGVGTAATQLARHEGAIVLGTLRTSSKADAARRFGCEHIIVCDEKIHSFAPTVLEITQNLGASLALDLLGGPYLPETVRCMSNQGRILMVGLLAGAKAELPLGEILSRRLFLKGSVLRSRSLLEKCQLSQAFERTLNPLFEKGILRPVLDEVFPFSEFEKAIARMSSNQNIGKIALSWNSP